MNVKQTVKRGRPPQTPAEAERVRAHIVTAAGEVFAEHGSHGTSVALIIERAGIARPTFYRYFANAHEPLHQLLAESDRALVDGVLRAVEAAGEGLDLALLVIDAYLEWARDRGPALRPLFAELHDPASPVSAHREHALGLLRSLAIEKMVAMGRTAPAPLDLDALLYTCEYIVFRISENGQPDDETIQSARFTMIRVALATLGMPADLAAALAVPGVFDAGARVLPPEG